MEYRPNSNPENSVGIRPESPILTLTEHYLLSCAVNLWDRSKYATKSTKETRLRSFIIHDWPHGLQPALNASSDAGFFFRR